MLVRKVLFILGMGIALVSFQNCSKVGLKVDEMSKMSADDPQGIDVSAPDVVDGDTDADHPTPGGTPVVDDGGKCDDKKDGDKKSDDISNGAPLDASCKKLVAGDTAIVYDSIAAANSAEQNFAIHSLSEAIKYENIGVVANGSASKILVQARSIGEVKNFSAGEVNLNALSIGAISHFSAGQVVVAAHKISEISSFSSKLCLSVQEIESMHSLSADMTIIGRKEGGKNAVIKEMKSLSAIVSLYDVDVEAIASGSMKMRVENGHIGSIGQGSASITLVNSSIDDISKFSGVIHLYGNSSVGSASSSSAKIVKH